MQSDFITQVVFFFVVHPTKYYQHTQLAYLPSHIPKKNFIVIMLPIHLSFSPSIYSHLSSDTACIMSDFSKFFLPTVSSDEESSQFWSPPWFPEDPHLHPHLLANPGLDTPPFPHRARASGDCSISVAHPPSRHSQAFNTPCACSILSISDMTPNPTPPPGAQAYSHYTHSHYSTLSDDLDTTDTEVVKMRKEIIRLQVECGELQGELTRIK